MASLCVLDSMALDDVAVWNAVAGEIEAIAASLARRSRSPRLSRIVRGLGAHTAKELSACAAELRANIALLESVPCLS